MTHSDHQAREQRARALVGLVKKVEGGYRVGPVPSPAEGFTRDPNTGYFVSKVDGRISCDCPDFEKHSQEDPRWECKHVLAVKLAYKLGKVNGKPVLSPVEGPAAQADLEVQAMFGDPEAARQIDAQAHQEGTETATATIDPSEGETGSGSAPGFNLSGSGFELIEVEEKVQLESCLVCKAPNPADEMIPISAPSGMGLVCRTCYDGRKACAFCGTRLPLDQLITISVSGRAGLVCEDCYSKSRSCSRCGDYYLVEQMVMVREPNFFGYFCSGCAEERKVEQRAEEARVVLTLPDRIVQTNEILAAWGLVAIETDQKGYTGYGFQYTIDAVNSALGLSAWRYKLLDQQVEKSDGKAFKAQVTLQLELRLDDGSWFTRGTQFGGSQNVDAADALKGALSDGLKKAFSHWGIGNLAYRGELNANSNNRK